MTLVATDTQESLAVRARREYERHAFILHSTTLALQQIGIDVAKLERSFSEPRE